MLTINGGPWPQPTIAITTTTQSKRISVRSTWASTAKTTRKNFNLHLTTMYYSALYYIIISHLKLEME